MVDCPICGKQVKESVINAHIDSGCTSHLEATSSPEPSQQNGRNGKQKAASFFSKPTLPRTPGPIKAEEESKNISMKRLEGRATHTTAASEPLTPSSQPPSKRSFDTTDAAQEATHDEPAVKKTRKTALENAAPLAERMRPTSLDDVCGQEALLGPDGVLRTLIETNRVPSMILWGGPGTGKTTISRLIAQTAGTRFVEINSTTTGVGEVKKLFEQARAELFLTGRKTIIFCDEIHRFSKSQQDVFLGPVEAGAVTLIG